LIGHLLERLIHEGRKGSVNIHLGKSLILSIPITQSLHTKIGPEQEPMEEIMAMSFLESFDKDLEEVAKDFIEEIEQP
jgi:hypothetical protein